MQALARSNHNVKLDFTRTSELVKSTSENLRRIIYPQEKEKQEIV